MELINCIFVCIADVCSQGTEGMMRFLCERKQTLAAENGVRVLENTQVLSCDLSEASKFDLSHSPEQYDRLII